MRFQSRKALHNFKNLYLYTIRCRVNFTKFWVAIFTCQAHIKFTKQEWVSEWVSELVTDKHNQWSDSGPIKMTKNQTNGKSAHSFEVFPLKKVTYNKWSLSMISNRIWYELQLLTLPTASPFVPICSPPFQSECHNDLEGKEIMILLVFSISSPCLIMSCNIILILE